MPYIERNEQGEIVAVSQVRAAHRQEELPAGHPELARFLQAVGGQAPSLDATDQGFVRVLEDLVDVLVEKEVILFTDLPEDAQRKISHRQRLRRELRGQLQRLEQGQAC